MKMNSAAKQITSEKFKELISACSLTQIAIAKRMGFHACNLSNLGTERGRERLTSGIWEKLQKAINSGDSLMIHFDKCYPENKDKETEQSLRVKVKPEALERRRKELEEIKSKSKSGNMVVNRECIVETDGKEINIRINIDLYINGKKVQI